MEMHSSLKSPSRPPPDDSLAASRVLYVCQDAEENGTSSTDSADEIPVWVRGEQRWISGVTDHTTASDLVDALLHDEGIASRGKDYVITERWRRVEQILDSRTRILKIWSAWGEAQAEVKLTLRRVERHQRRSPSVENCDSGRGSPTGSAIVRRRRHRAAKSTAAWITHAQTPHPRTQRATIERLMKLILEQGETIQHQLSRLRERELEISYIEEERHRIREREHGKNYLLETYLNGLHEADDKEVTTGNSDSGVHTEDTTSPAGISPILDDQEESGQLEEAGGSMKRKSRSQRETMLLREHETAKEFSAAAEKNKEAPSKEPSEVPDDVTAEIDLLEKMYVLNKHLQREEELVVRLSAKVKRYESENPALSEHQIMEALERVNEEIAQKNSALEATDRELEASMSALQDKSQELQDIHEQLKAAEVESQGLEEVRAIPENSLNLSREYLAENIYNISKIILKSNAKDDVGNYIRHTPERDVLRPPIPVDHIPKAPVHFTTEVQVHQAAASPLPPQLPPPQFIDFTTLDLIASMNRMHQCSQRNINSVATAGKIAHKKMIGTEADSNSDTGLSSLGEDMTQLGTLV
ncbi:ras association domain-containing protein 10 isoform X2 [Phlebotomus argentipes]|uniref:ras association domain-containing protein 10 isoform X2 n=1 Tax=Phlebotomus argentipes TaxID=94469 RepID=UPI002893005A|nr:ras association domain-containing protein 10 isoform X2 [Phlebotomus argentipes]